MTTEFQTLAALALVALAATWLVRRAFAKKQNPDCGSDCGCASKKVSSAPRRP
ncbi:MAG: FeoB-associated Cys-rich membrane protein [Opitutaceae bacterium]